jgi:uncharacterized protein involved in response to NO
MKSVFKPLFVVYCLLWCMVRLLRQAQHPIPFINDYLTDFLFVPVVAHLSVSFTRRFIVRNNVYDYPLTYLLFIAFYAAVLFEYIMPEFSGVYTADPGDVLAYFSGSLFYYYIHERR